MSQDAVRYDNDCEMVSTFNPASSVRKVKLDSIEEHASFKSLEK